MIDPFSLESHQALRRCIAMLGERDPDGSVSASGDLVLFQSSIDLARFSGIRVPVGALDEADLRREVGFFVRRDKPWSISTIGEPAPSVRSVAEELDLERDDRPVMAMTLSGTSERGSEPGERIAFVTAETHRDYAETLSIGFGMPLELAHQLSADWVLSTPGVRACVAYRGDRPVTSGMTILDSQGWLGVYNISTVPSARRSGTAERMVRHLLAQGVEDGATAAALVTSPAGQGVYQRIGFTTVEPHQVMFHTT